MKRFLMAVLVLFLFELNGPAQNKTADGLKLSLVTEKTDTGQIKLLLQLSKFYRESKPDTALLLAQQGLLLSQKIRSVKEEADCINHIGIIYTITGNYSKALEKLLQCLKLREPLHDKEGIAKCNSNIGIVYIEQGDYRKGLAYFFNSKLIAETLHNDILVMKESICLGDAFEKMNRLDSARFYTQEAYELADRLDDVEAKGLTLTNLGNINAKMNLDDVAMGYYRHGIPYIASLNDDEDMCESVLGMAQLFKKAGQIDSALHYARESLALAERGGFTKKILYASVFLSAYYKSIHLVDSAYYYQDVTITAKDSLFSQEKIRELQNLSFAEQIRQGDIEMAAVVANKQRKNNLQMMLIGAFIPLFFGMVLLFSKRKTKPGTIEFMGLLGLLLFFEFIALFIHPYIETWTNHTPVFMLIMLVCVASLLVPLHHRLQYWVKERLTNKHIPVAQPAAAEVANNSLAESSKTKNDLL